MTQWTLARIRTVVRKVTAHVAVGEEIEAKELTVTMKVSASLKEEQAQRQALVDAKSTDVEFDHLKQNIVVDIKGGPIDESGTPYTLEEMLLIGPIRTAISKEHELVQLGLRRKNS